MHVKGSCGRDRARIKNTCMKNIVISTLDYHPMVRYQFSLYKFAPYIPYSQFHLHFGTNKHNNSHIFIPSAVIQIFSASHLTDFARLQHKIGKTTNASTASGSGTVLNRKHLIIFKFIFGFDKEIFSRYFFFALVV